MAREMGMEGKVYVQFTVEKDGSIGDVKIMRGFDRECEREVIRVIKLMPNWEPGMQEGKPVRTRFTLPVVFSLQ
jgi:protein TonB